MYRNEKINISILYNQEITSNIFSDINTIKTILLNKSIMVKIFNKILFDLFKSEKIKFNFNLVYHKYLQYEKIFYFFNKDIIITFFLLKNLLLDNSTIININMYISLNIFQHNKNINYILILKNIINEIKNNYLTEYSLSNQIQNISSIFNVSIEILWNFITKWEFAKILYNHNLYKIIFIGNPQIKNSLIKCIFFDNNKNKLETETKVLKSEKNNFKYEYFIEPILGNKYINEIHFIFVKINNNQTYLSYDTVFKEKMKYIQLIQIKKNKEKIFNSIQRILI